MKRSVTINLAGLVYNIDEDAFQMLKDYLDKIEKKFKNDEASSDIMHDIEARIAEILNERITHERQVVTVKDVEEIIRTMGHPNDYTGEEHDEQKDTSSSYSAGYRRMYRDPDNRIIGGVCSGLAAYWRIDPSILRVIFVLLTIFGLAGILIYLILWIVLPEAKTVAQKLEMRGEPVTISNIKDFVKREFENVKKSFK
jgi:phage shock protein PspC (stress-responsive transcriptional regulator)